MRFDLTREPALAWGYIVSDDAVEQITVGLTPQIWAELESRIAATFSARHQAPAVTRAIHGWLRRIAPVAANEDFAAIHDRLTTILHEHLIFDVPPRNLLQNRFSFYFYKWLSVRARLRGE